MPARCHDVAARPWHESLERSRTRRAAASRGRRRRLRGQAALASGMAAMTVLGGVAFAATAHSSHHLRHLSTLSPGAHGAAVSALQRALGIPQTGNYDSATTRAVRRYQARNGLAVDGIAGPQTLAALGLASRTQGAGHRYRGGLDAELAKIAQCESGGDPHAVSADGHFRGKYQFDRETWRQIGGTGDPAQAPESVQDRLAGRLLRARGTAPWPNCA